MGILFDEELDIQQLAARGDADRVFANLNHPALELEDTAVARWDVVGAAGITAPDPAALRAVLADRTR